MLLGHVRVFVVTAELRELTEFMDRVRERTDALRREVARHEGARETIVAALTDAESRVQETGKEVEILIAVADILQGMEGAFQRNFQSTLAAVVSEGLSQVFGEVLEVQIAASTRADLSAINFQLIKNGQEEDIMEGQGGGYINIIAFLLRVLLILAARPLLRRLLVLDEPFAHLSPEFRQSLAEMMQALITRLDFQVIMITQEWEYVAVADVAYKAEIKDGATRFRVIAETQKALEERAPEKVAAE